MALSSSGWVVMVSVIVSDIVSGIVSGIVFGIVTGIHWGDPDVDGRIILRCTFRKWKGFVGTGWSGLRIGTGGEHL
jgi:hypothetical protein